MNIGNLERLDDLQGRLSRQHRRRSIPWDELNLASIPETARRRVGQAWLWRAKQEHLAVGAFAHVTCELAEEGCDPVVLGLIARAASDEVRHTALCAEYARRLLDDPEVLAWRMRGTPVLPSYPEATLSQRVLYHVVEMCCFSETLTGIYLTEARDRATHPTGRTLVECLLEDEVDHGRVGWAYLKQRRDDGTLGDLSEALPGIVHRTVGSVLKLASQQPDPDTEHTLILGHLGLQTSALLYREGLEQIILPGLEAVGVKTEVIRSLIESDSDWYLGTPGT